MPADVAAGADPGAAAAAGASVATGPAEPGAPSVTATSAVIAPPPSTGMPAAAMTAPPSVPTGAPGAEPARGEQVDLSPRAVERALTLRGGLLLPVWGAEVVPELSYAHSSFEAIAAIGGAAVNQRVRTHVMTGSLTGRVGLPWGFQVEAQAPYLAVRQTVVFNASVERDTDGAGLGDVRLALTRQLIRGRRTLPDLLVTAIWKTATGTSPYEAAPDELPRGTGFDAFGATATLAKASDPLVFLARMSYLAHLGGTIPAGRIDPGDDWGLGVGTLLAVSPDTSMSFLFDLSYSPGSRLDGTMLPGTDATGAVLQLGVSMLMSRRTLLNVNAGIGLTSDVPDFQLGVSFPVRL